MNQSNLKKISHSLGERFYTLELASNLLNSFRGNQIVQVGCQDRDFLYSNYDLFNVLAELREDISLNIYHDQNEDEYRINKIQREIYKKYDRSKITIDNIINYNPEDINKIDLLVLHDIHFPINELITKISHDLNILEARSLLNTIEKNEFNALFGGLLTECREKMLNDYKTFRSRLGGSAIVILEGSDYPGGSQTLLADKQLESDGFICLLNLKQSVWVRR